MGALGATQVEVPPDSCDTTPAFNIHLPPNLEEMLPRVRSRYGFSKGGISVETSLSEVVKTKAQRPS